MEEYKKKFNIGIYQIVNLINNKKYIGQSCRIRKRWVAHRRELNDKTHRNQYLERSWHKYGEDNFEFKVILYCDRKDLGFYEMIVAKYYQSFIGEYGYNLMAPNGENGICHSEETKRKISIAMEGKKRSLETRKKMSIAKRGVKRPPWTEEHKRNHSKSLKGIKKRPMSQATKDKLSAINMGSNHPMYGKSISAVALKKLRKRMGSYEGRLKIAVSNGAKPFIVFKDGGKVGEWIIKSKCAREIGVFRATINNYIDKGIACQAGFSFEYIK